MKRAGTADRCRSVPDMDEGDRAGLAQSHAGPGLLVPRHVQSVVRMIGDQRLTARIEAGYDRRVVEEASIAAVAVIGMPDTIEDQVADFQVAGALTELADARLRHQVLEEAI